MATATQTYKNMEKIMLAATTHAPLINGYATSAWQKYATSTFGSGDCPTIKEKTFTQNIMYCNVR